MTSITVNGKATEVQAEADTPLLWLLRGELHHDLLCRMLRVHAVHRFTQVGLDYFLTEDHRSILCYKERLLALGIKAVCSLELLAALK